MLVTAVKDINDCFSLIPCRAYVCQCERSSGSLLHIKKLYWFCLKLVKYVGFELLLQMMENCSLILNRMEGYMSLVIIINAASSSSHWIWKRRSWIPPKDTGQHKNFHREGREIGSGWKETFSSKVLKRDYFAGEAGGHLVTLPPTGALEMCPRRRARCGPALTIPGPRYTDLINSVFEMEIFRGWRRRLEKEGTLTQVDGTTHIYTQRTQKWWTPIFSLLIFILSRGWPFFVLLRERN